MSKRKIIQDFFDQIIDVSQEIASKKYILLILSDLLKDQLVDHLFIQHIKFENDKIYISEEIEEYDQKEIVEVINKIYNFLFFNITKKLLKNKTDSNLYSDFKEFGFDV